MDPMFHIQQLQQRRGRRERDVAIANVIQRVASDAKRHQRRFSSFIEVWDTHVPDALSRHCAIDTIRAGVAQILVSSASVRYALDRFLREGGLDALRNDYAGPLRKVRVRVGDPKMFELPDTSRDNRSASYPRD